MRRYTHSSSLKMALLFALLLGVSTIILGYFIYAFSERSFIRETEAAIDAEINGLREWYALGGETQLREILAQRDAARREGFYLLLDVQGKKLAGNLRALPAEVSLLAEGVVQFYHDSRLLAAKIDTLDQGQRLFVARDIEEISTSFHQMQWLAVLIIILMAVVVGVSFIISTFVVSRTNLIVLTAGEIMKTGDLSRRISIATGWDDLSHMAQVLNALLARIETLMQGIRQVSDNIAHDLRTPLTRLRNKLEPLEDQTLLTEADHLLTTFSALLRISNLEVGKRHAQLAPVALQPLLSDVIELYEPLAEEKDIALRSELTPAFCSGDQDLLFQMFANLLDNAIKFTPEGGRITVILTGQKVLIADSGIGVEEVEKPRLFERFYRSEQSRSTAGSGLGLSLVAAIAEIHQAQLTLKDNHPGLAVEVVFPSQITNR